MFEKRVRANACMIKEERLKKIEWAYMHGSASVCGKRGYVQIYASMKGRLRESVDVHVCQGVSVCDENGCKGRRDSFSSAS